MPEQGRETAVPAPFNYPSDGFLTGKSPAATQDLLSRQRRFRGTELLAIAQTCLSDPLDSVFRPLFGELQRLPPRAFWRVWSTPFAGFWTHLAAEILQSRFSGALPSLLGSHLRWCGNDADSFAFRHFGQLGVFIVAASVLEGSAVTLPVPACLDAKGSLPGIGVSWDGSELRLLGCADDGRLIIQRDGNACAVEVADHPAEQTPFFRTPKAGVHHNLLVDVWESCLRADYIGMEQCPRVTGYANAVAASERVTDAVVLIREYSAALFDEVNDVVSVVVPIQPSRRGVYPSGTCSSCPGAVFLTIADRADILAELVIHECSHSKLFLMQAQDPLFEPSKAGQRWADARYYSPWKDAPRPLPALLHAMFVFTEVAAFWEWRFLTAGDLTVRNLAARRLKTLCCQLELGQRSLQSSAHFTSIGQDLLRELSIRLNSVSETACAINGETTEAMHVLSMPVECCGVSVAEAVRRHFNNYGCQEAQS